MDEQIAEDESIAASELAAEEESLISETTSRIGDYVSQAKAPNTLRGYAATCIVYR